MDEAPKEPINNLISTISEEFKENKYISIEDIDYFEKKVKITSPRSLKAMGNLGINNSDLEYLTFEEFLSKNPVLIADDKKMKRYKYEQVEIIRKNAIDQVREARKQIIEENLSNNNKRCISSKLRTNINLNNTSNKSKTNMQLFEEKDIKAFKRMKNINKTNLVNRVEIELKKVINQLINNEKDKKKKENEIKYLKKREWRMKTENKKKMKEEEEKIKMAKEMDKIKRKEEEKRIEYLIAEEEEEEKRIKRIQDEEKSLKKEAQKKQEEYQKNLKELRKLRHEKIVEDSRKKELRLAKNMLRIFKEKKRKRLNSEKNYRQKRIEIEKNLKKLNEENEIKNKLVIYKQQKQEIKKLQDEERLNKEIKLYQKNLAKSNKNFKNYYRNKTQDGLLSLAKLEDYNNNQMNSIKKQKSLNDLLKSQPYLNEKERKQKETLYKNQIILNKRKEEIMNKIHEKEKNIERTQYEKNYINYLEKKDQVKKQKNKQKKIMKDNLRKM